METNCQSSRITGNAMVLATMLLTIAGIGNAYAGDVKTVSGNACQPEFGSQRAYFNNHGSGIYNTTGSARSVVCPIVRDNRRNTNGIKSMSVYINQATNVSTQCTLMAKYIDGATKRPSSIKTRWGSGYLYPKVTTSAVNGSYSLQCSLGGKAKITTILWEEY